MYKCRERAYFFVLLFFSALKLPSGEGIPIERQCEHML